MKTSARGICAIARHEGIVPAPYRDSVGVWTVGIGHTAAAGDPDPARMHRGMPADIDGAILDMVRLFEEDLGRYEAEVDAALRVPVAQHEFDALVSWHYNTGAVARASLVRALNDGDRRAAADGFMAWTRPPELIARRREERALFLGTYPEGPIPVWAADPGGEIDWRRPIRSLSQDELLRLMKPRHSPSVPVKRGLGMVQRLTLSIRNLFTREMR